MATTLVIYTHSHDGRWEARVSVEIPIHNLVFPVTCHPQRIMLLVGWLRRMANTVGPFRTVTCAPPAFWQGRVRVLIYDSGNDGKARWKSFLLLPLHCHRMLSLPSSEILTGHYSSANGGPIDSTRNVLVMRVIVSDFYTTLALFSPQATPGHQTSKHRIYSRRQSRLYRSAPSDGRASTLTQGR